MDKERGKRDFDGEVTRVYEETTTGTKVEAEQTAENNGAIFGFLSIPVITFSLLTATWHLITYLNGYGFSRNSTKLWMGLEEPFEYSATSQSLMTAHALLALSVLVLSLYQATTGALLSLQTDKNKKVRMQKSHRVGGWIIGTVLLTVYVSGVVSVYTSSKLSAGRADKSFWSKLAHDAGFMILGAGCIVNLILALWAVCGPKHSRDYIMHKGCMCFSFFWILGVVALPELCINLMQFFVRHCVIDGSAIPFVSVVTQPIQLGVMAYCGYRWGGAAFRRRFVTINMTLLFLLMAYNVAAVVYFVNNPSGDGNCLSDGIF